MTCRRIVRPSRNLSSRVATGARITIHSGWMAVVACIVVAGGCESSPSEPGMSGGGNGGGSSSMTGSNGNSSVTPRVDDSTIARLENEYPFGPQAARTIDYRIDWKTNRGGDGVEMMRVQGDSVFVLDRFNVLTRLHRGTGDVIWRTAVESEITEVVGINYVPAANRVFVATGGSFVVLEGDTGSLVARQTLTKIINTQAVAIGPFLVYGSRDGELVWHRYDIEYPWRAYTIGQSIHLAPVVMDNLAITLGNGGELFVLDVGSAQQLWSRRMDDPVDAQPEVGAGVVYVAGRDQFVRAFDLQLGRQYWNFITPAPLKTSPTLIGDRVYQDVPGSGVIALEALPIDRIGGVEIWNVEGASGRVITRHEEKLLTWDGENRTMSVIDDGAGMLITNIPLPDVRFLISTGRQNGVLYAASDDGRIMQLSPTH